jgi:hypothetical protein
MSARKTKPSIKAASQPPEVLPFRLYDMTELASILGVSFRYVKAIKDAGAPFALGRTRPEWVLKWLEEHAMDPELQGKICA